MDIKNYGKQNINDFVEKVDAGTLSPDEQNTIKNIENAYGGQIDDLISKFQDLDETQLMGEIFKIINKQKQDGTFDPQKIKELASSIRPLLNDDQKAKLDELLTIISFNQ